MFYTYLLRCVDNSLYTGITTDLTRRMGEHFSGGKQCAKYTRTHPPVRLETAWCSKNRSDASRLEAHIKGLPKSKKEAMLHTAQYAFGKNGKETIYRCYDKRKIAKINALLETEFQTKITAG